MSIYAKLFVGHQVSMNDVIYNCYGSVSLRKKYYYLLQSDVSGVKMSLLREDFLQYQKDSILKVIVK